MDTAIMLSIAASFCTAMSSVCQRLGARNVEVKGFDAWLVFRLARRPVWLLGFAAMIAGFVLQVSALHFGPLALVQPILAVELLFVFGYLAVIGSRRVRLREWLAVIAMSAGISVFLRAASPGGGRLHAPASLWWLAGLVTLGCVLLALAAGLGPARETPAHRAAVLGVATGISWGFVAAVIKELSSHVGDGLGAVFGNWAVYVLLGAGAATMLLTSHALAAGPLAASQPGFTILDPITASLLGVFLFNENLQTGAAALTAQVLGLVVLIAGVSALSHSRLITGEDQQHPSGAASLRARADSERTHR
jgi:drug/metabolite transporter (DMT)-like permease